MKQINLTVYDLNLLELHKYLPKEEETQDDLSQSDSRYMDFDQLKYSLERG